MKTTSERLKEILYIRNLKQADLVEMSGIGKSAISQYLSGKVVPKQDKIYVLSEVLHIDPAWLMGYDVPMDPSVLETTSWQPNITQRDLKEINNIIANARDLLHQDGLMFDGKPATEEDVESILSAMEVGLEMAKKKSKEKFTPKKYKEK